MKHSRGVVATLEILHTTIRRAQTCSCEELIAALGAVAEYRQSPTPIAVVARHVAAASAG